MLTIRATAVGEATILAGIVRMVEEAQAAKLTIQGGVDRVVRWFVPAILGIAGVTVAARVALRPDPALGLALVSGVAVLISACPCAMGGGRDPLTGDGPPAVADAGGVGDSDGGCGTATRGMRGGAR